MDEWHQTNVDLLTFFQEQDGDSGLEEREDGDGQWIRGQGDHVFAAPLWCLDEHVRAAE